VSWNLSETCCYLHLGGGEIPLVLVEAFSGDSDTVGGSASANASAEPKPKRRKTEMVDDSSGSAPSLTVARPGNMLVVHNFLMAVRCWDLLHSSDSLERGN
jgi:hypothetical protein